jgi:hypothetical protein
MILLHSHRVKVLEVLFLVAYVNEVTMSSMKSMCFCDFVLQLLQLKIDALVEITFKLVIFQGITYMP